jgi:hypothetical protein
MRILSKQELVTTSAGLMPPHTLLCLNTKIRVTAGASEHDFDTEFAGWALHKACPMDFGTWEDGRDYANMIQSMMPPAPPMPPIPLPPFPMP